MIGSDIAVVVGFFLFFGFIAWIFGNGGPDIMGIYTAPALPDSWAGWILYIPAVGFYYLLALGLGIAKYPILAILFIPMAVGLIRAVI